MNEWPKRNPTSPKHPPSTWIILTHSSLPVVMKRTLEADLPSAQPDALASSQHPSSHPTVVTPPQYLLFVLTPMKIPRVRKTLSIPFDVDVHDYLSIFEYEIGSANPKLKLEDRLQSLVEEHEPFQHHPDCIADVDMTSLPLLLMFAGGSYEVCRLPSALTQDDVFATATRQDLGKWEHDITDGENHHSFQKGAYKAVHFIPFDPAVIDQAIEEEGLNEDA